MLWVGIVSLIGVYVEVNVIVGVMMVDYVGQRFLTTEYFLLLEKQHALVDYCAYGCGFLCWIWFGSHHPMHQQEKRKGDYHIVDYFQHLL